MEKDRNYIHLSVEDKMKPYQFQRECLAEMQQEKFNGRVLLNADMGLGKTPMSLWNLQKNFSRALPCIIICPASLKYQWKNEVKSVLGIKAFVAEGRAPSKTKRVPKIVIINYDILQYWLQWLKNKQPQSIVIDECQFIANPSTHRTKAVKTLCFGMNNITALSGTPLMNRPIELFPILNILKPITFSSRWSYGMKYCGGKRNQWGWEFKGATNIEKLNKLLLDTCMVRRRKYEVLKDLPAKLRQVIPCKLSKSEYVEYNKANNDFLNWLGERDPEAVVRAERAEAVVKLGYLLRLVADLKLKYVVQWVQDFLESTDRKLVVFANHRNVISNLNEQIKSKSVVIDGSVPSAKRQEFVKRFQTDDRIRVFIGNIKAAGVGLNLTASSDTVFTEMAWRPSDHTQAEDRCHRIGQRDTVWAHYFVAENTIEEELCKIIQQKQEVISNILDGKSVLGTLDVFDEFVRTINKRKGLLKW